MLQNFVDINQLNPYRVSQGRQLSNSAMNRSLCSALYGNPNTLLGNPHLPPSGAGHNGSASPHRRDSFDNSSWLSKDYNSSPGRSPSGSIIGISERRKSDLPPRPFPFNSMRSQNSYSSNHGKQWTSPEVRGTVGLPWPAMVDGLYTPSPLTSLPATPHHEVNLNASHEFLQHVHAATSYMGYGGGRPNGAPEPGSAAGGSGSLRNHPQPQAVWPQPERGPLLFQQTADIQNSNLHNGMRKEVNNNPRILHEMSTEL